MTLNYQTTTVLSSWIFSAVNDLLLELPHIAEKRLKLLGMGKLAPIDDGFLACHDKRVAQLWCLIVRQNYLRYPMPPSQSRKPAEVKPQRPNPGIGTTAPTTKLSVNGGASVNGTLDVTGKIKSENARATTSATSAITTTSATFVDTGLQLSIDTAGGYLLILADIPGIDSSGGDFAVMFRITIDGVQVGAHSEQEASATGIVWSTHLHALALPSAGTHVIKLQWANQTGGSGRINGASSTLLGSRVLSAIEL